jgi:hypothetical protein
VNDPVMGGVSHATFKVNTQAGTASFTGDCKIVPKLKAPGFCNAETTNLLKTAPDASAYLKDSLLINAKSTVAYAGFKVTLAADTLDRQFESYKAPFQVPADGQYHVVAVPFSEFSNDWSPFTGGCSTIDPTGKA